MSAQVISFSARRSYVTQRGGAAAVGSAAVVQLHAPPAHFWEDDLPTLRAYMPKLAGSWTLTSSAGEASLARKSGWEAFRRHVIIRREGTQLRLMIDRPASGLETIGLFHTMALVMEVLADDVGRRRSKGQR